MKIPEQKAVTICFILDNSKKRKMLSIGFVFIWLVLGMYLKDCNAQEVEECLGIRNTCEINDLSLELFHSGMVRLCPFVIHILGSDIACGAGCWISEYQTI